MVVAGSRTGKSEHGMELRWLETFLRVVETRSFTEAARRRGLSQAAVSQQIAALEKDLGCRLLERAPGHVQLTAAGERLLPHARQLLRLAQQARQAVIRSGGRPEYALQIASSTVPAETLLPVMLADLRKVHPEIRETVVVTDSAGATRAVLSGDADVGFVGERLPRPGLVFESVAEDRLVLIAPADAPWLPSGRVTPRRLRQLPLIVREAGSGTRHCLDLALQRHGMGINQLNVVLEVNSNEAIRQGVRQGMGAAFISDRLLAGLEGQVRRLSLQGLSLRRRLFLIYLRHRSQEPGLRVFRQFVRRWSKQRRGEG